MTFIIAMIIIILTAANGQVVERYYYTINEVTTYEHHSECEAQIAKRDYQQQILEGFNTVFGSRVARIRLACLTGSDNVADYRQFMKERNFIMFHHTQNLTPLLVYLPQKNFPYRRKYFEQLKK